MSVRLTSVALAAGTAHTNSTTETQVARRTIPANGLKAGVVHHFTGFARVTSSNGSDTATPRIRFGSSSTTTSNDAAYAGSAVDAVNDDVFVWDVYVQARDSDTSSTVLVWGTASPADASGTGAVMFAKVYTAIDLTAATYLDATIDWSAASADNSVQSEAVVTDSGVV